MAVLKRILILVAISAAVLSLGACTRKITRIEQVAQAPTACFECHSDTTTALLGAAQSWQYSVHASGSTLFETGSSCAGCHTSEGFIARSNGLTPGEIAHPTAIGCFTCHAPHTNGDFRLRWTNNATLMNGTTYDLGDGNLCAACHMARRNINTYITSPQTTMSSRFGPHHGPQADMLIGSNGYEYAGYAYESSNHRSALANGCVDCHYETATGLSLGGHSFNMTYSVEGVTASNTAACEDCHGAIDSFSSIGNGYSIRDSVDVLVADLQARLEAAGLMANGTPKSVKTSPESAGAVYNLVMVKEDRSHGAHNAKYTLGLLRSAIQFISGPAPQQVATRATRK